MPWEKQFDKQAALGRALDSFWANGYEATSMQDLVDCTGVNRGSLYATYGDKRALFLAALKAYDDARRAMLSELEKRYDAREAIRQVFQAFTNEVSESGGNRGCFLTNTALELAAHDAEIRQIVAKAQEDVEAFFARLIRQGKAAGEIPEHLKVAETARGLLASLLGFLVLIRSRPERTLLRAIIDDALKRLD
jgi:TetR/AcrR family transcriptional repressor of nem operon